MSSLFTPGSIVASRYLIIGSIGSGGMAQVYRARHLTLGREVALKVMSGSDGGATDERFVREAQNMGALNHPGCVRVVDFGSAVDGTRFLVMDLVQGQTLDDVLRDTPQLPASRAIQIADALLGALQHAHNHHVLHRDVKPTNVMIGNDGRVVLIDFGLSESSTDTPLTALGSCVGSPAYLAPERLLGQPYDHRSDLYAVGLVLYEMLAGTRVFEADTPLDIARAQIQCTPVCIGDCRSDISKHLSDTVHQAISKQPHQRFDSARDMQRALRAASPLGQAPGLWSRLGFGRRRWSATVEPPQSTSSSEVPLF